MFSRTESTSWRPLNSRCEENKHCCTRVHSAGVSQMYCRRHFARQDLDAYSIAKRNVHARLRTRERFKKMTTERRSDLNFNSAMEKDVYVYLHAAVYLATQIRHSRNGLYVELMYAIVATSDKDRIRTNTGWFRHGTGAGAFLGIS